MKKRIVNITLLFCCCLLISCTDVFYIDLGNNYAWTDQILVKITEEKNRCLYYDVLIYPQVLNYDYDDKFIVAYQVYDGSPSYNLDDLTPNRDSLLNQFLKVREIKHCYWIIDKENDLVMGPMPEDEFNRKCKQLHVKAKMRRFFQKRFYPLDSTDIVNLDSMAHTLTDSVMQKEVKSNK